GDRRTSSRASRTATTTAGSTPVGSRSGGSGSRGPQRRYAPPPPGSRTQAAARTQNHGERYQRRAPRGAGVVAGFTSWAGTSALPFAEHNHPVRRAPREAFLAAVGPDDVQGVHGGGRPQAEVGARVVAAQVTRTGVDQSQPAPAPRPDGHLGAVG